MNSTELNDRKVSKRIAYIIGSFPSLTTTFILREVLEAKRQESNLILLSIRQPRPFEMSEEIASLARQTHYLLPASWFGVLRAGASSIVMQPRIFLSTLYYLLSRPHAGIAPWLKTILHFGEGVYAASILREQGAEHIHAHFADRAATIALVASRLIGCKYSVTAHANDIYVSPALLPEKIGNAKFTTTCTGYNKDHLEALTGKSIELIYHGLDLESIQPSVTDNIEHDPPLILAVGQLKQKKGFPVLLKACAIIKRRGVTFRCQIVGDGPDRETLEQLQRELDLFDDVSFLGAQSNDTVMRIYEDATLFALPCVIAENDDRDGIPNVLLEAMAFRVPVISTPVSGIPEILDDGVTGLLSDPGDESSLADAIERLLGDPELRAAIGDRARSFVQERFDIRDNIGRLLQLLEGDDSVAAANQRPEFPIEK